MIKKLMECGVKFTKGIGFAEYGVKEINDAIAAGRRVAKIETNIRMDKGETKDGMVQLFFSGCKFIVTIEEPTT